MVVLCAGVLVAAGASAHAPSQADAPQQGFRAGVDRVRVDVIVTDRDDRFVDDLTAGDFTLYDDGVPQDILGIDLVDLAAGTIHRLGPGALATPPALAAQPPPAAAEEQGPSVESMGALAFVVDAGALGYWERRRFIKGWIASLEPREPSEGFSFPRAVYMLNYRGALRELAPLTHDADVLRRVTQEISDAIYAPDELGWRGLGSPVAVSRASRQTLRTLAQICEELAVRRGRKALVWVSPGVSLQRGPSDNDERALRLMDELQEAANAAGVSIYAVDPTLVTQRAKFRPWTDITSRVGPAESIRRDPIEKGVWAFDAVRDSLYAAARGTGGKAYPFETHIDETLQEIERDTSRFYLLTYATPPPVADGDYHAIEVKLGRGEFDVRARAGYIDR
jgi:VWFA-related protein